MGECTPGLERLHLRAAASVVTAPPGGPTCWWACCGRSLQLHTDHKVRSGPLSLQSGE